MQKEHTVKTYEAEIRELNAAVLEMARRTMGQLEMAVRVIESRDAGLAARLVSGDQGVDALEMEVDALTVRLLATRQPMATDLRMTVSVLRIAAELERIADYAAGMGKLVHCLDGETPVELIRLLREMLDIAIGMLSDLVVAYQELDPGLAVAVWRRDEGIDRLYGDFLNQLQLFMSRSPDRVPSGTGLLLMGRHSERIGDHLTNIAENIYFIATGENLLRPANEP
ncbi:MAG: phosphate signaling complex protein PhoU [Acidobacteria bacterium]|nr:phosphate signaling complex protein PhoU [Acidobacteriota bacterium]